MQKNKYLPVPNAEKTVYGRQIAFFACFILPAVKLFFAPRLLADKTGGDLVVCALIACVASAVSLFAVLFAFQKTGKGVFTLVRERLGKTAYKIVLTAYATYFLFSALPLLLDVEKMVYPAFYDTAPSAFVFAPFFLFSAFFCGRSVRAIGRLADVSLLLFCVPFLFTVVASAGTAEFSAVFPFLSSIKTAFSGVKSVAFLFFDVAVLLPFLERCTAEKRATLKIGVGYGVGVVSVLVFCVLFYGTYGAIARREEFAVLKIAQYFPALSVVGRVDLIFVYALIILLFFAVCTPLAWVVECVCLAFPKVPKTYVSVLLSVGVFFFTLFFNKRYDFFMTLAQNAFLVFALFSLVFPVLFAIFLPKWGRQVRKTQKGDEQ